MSNKGFRADSWLNSSFNISSAKDASPVSPSDTKHTHAFKPAGHLIPGWKGDSLPSKTSVILSRSIIELWQQAKQQLSTFKRPTKSMATMVHEEFMLYCSSRELSLKGLESVDVFWQHLHDDKSKFANELALFRDIYCFRAVTVYLFKIRFLNILTRHLGQSFGVAQMANPSNLISKLFRAGSSTELICESLRPNCYSWFRPCSENHGGCLEKLRDVLELTHITEMVKLCSFRNVKGEDFKQDELFDDAPYSHSLSHRAFGRFINLNLVYMPHWLNERSFNANRTSPQQLETIKTKFSGDQLPSLCLSHWLAQEEYVHQNWQEIICPDFVGQDFTDGPYVKICHELQFLTFLVKVSKEQKFDPLTLIANTMRRKYEKAAGSNGQFALFGSEQNTTTGYDRIVLNLTKTPKNNPHQHLISRVREQLKFLDRDGWLFVFSSQKLFVPSRTDKLQQLLTLAKVHAGISLEGVSGKGEIPHYLYIFTHRNNAVAPAGKRESYQHFQFDGELNMFSRFAWYPEELEKFFFSRAAYATPLYQSENDGRLFNFHQDALFEGKLLTSASDDHSRITHPAFFKKLTAGCVPLDQFFLLEGIDEKNSSNLHQDFLGLLFKPKQHHPYVLVVDTRNPEQVELELIAAESYKAKKELYGTAYFEYFGLMPKMAELNPNLFRVFFQSQLGRQLIQLSLGGNPVNLKSKLSSMLIPGFFSIPRYLPDDVQEIISHFEFSSQKLLGAHPQELVHGFEQAERLLRENATNYGWHGLSLLANYRVQLISAAQSLERSTMENINYQNPLILEPLLKLKPIALFPHHEDLFVKFVTGDRSKLERPIDRINLVKSSDNPYLQIFEKEEVLVELYGNEDFLHFVRFVLSTSIGLSFANVLHHLQLPRASELAQVVTRYRSLADTINDITRKTDLLINNIFHQQLVSNP